MKAWDELAGEPLRFPINGTTYEVAPLSIDDGLRVFMILQGKDPDWSDDRPMTDFYQLVMGETWNQMRADGVSLDAATRAGLSTMTDIQQGREAAEAMWESGVDPEGLAAWMAATPSTPSTGTESASETPSPASTPPTTSLPATPPGEPKTKTRQTSPGPKSSTSGTSSSPTGQPSTDTA